jgi:ElaB/YqjD/DUF883 family membrane-anchored ribosome-binding protein
LVFIFGLWFLLFGLQKSLQTLSKSTIIISCMTFENYTLIGLIAIFGLLVFWIIRLEIKLGRLLAGKSGNLDDSVVFLKNKIGQLEKFRGNTEIHLDTLDKKARQAICGVETVRFNPYKGTGVGGNQSFATAFVNSEGNGVVISTLYAREHNSIFGKPIKKTASAYEMTLEEKEALDKAHESATEIKI